MKRRWLWYALLIAFVWLVTTRFAEIRGLVEVLVQGQPGWILAALVLQAAYYLVFSASYQAAFYTVEVRSRLFKLVPVVFGSLFVNVAAPAGGTAGAALFVDDAANRGESPGRTAAGTVLQLIADFVTLLVVLVFGLAYLFTQNELQTYEVIGAIALLGITLGWSGILVLGLWRPNWLHRFLAWVQRLANGLAHNLKRSDVLRPDWAEENAKEFNQAGQAIARHPNRLAITLGVALVAHMIDIASLYTLFRAFNQTVHVGALIAGYAVGILFWVVSITPQGIGVVEGVMTLVYSSLGVPASTAAVVTLAFRGLSFWLPLGIGFILIRRMKSFGAQEHSLAENWTVRVVALLTAMMGGINLLSAITPALRNRLVYLEPYIPMVARRGGRLTAALAGFALFLLAGGLARRKRTAWLLTLGVLVLSAASNLVKGLDYEAAILASGLAVWLAFLRPHFHARSDPPSIRQGLRVLAIALAFTMAYGATGFYLLDRHYRVHFGVWAALRQTVVMFTQFYDPGLQPITGFGRYFAESIYVVGAATLGYALLMLVRPVLIRKAATTEQRARAREIAEAYGHTSLARMALFEDKSYHFSPGGSAIAFVVKGRVALALGDPIGPREDMKACIAHFQERCRRSDWRLAFYQTLPDALEVYHQSGFDSVCIGQEAILDLTSFTLEGGAYKNIRTAVNRLTKLGYQTEILPTPLPDPIFEQLQQISDEWLTSMHGSEKRFSLGWFNRSYLESTQIMAVSTPEGLITAFANLIPTYHCNTVALDLMRRREDVLGGTMDFLLAKMIAWASEEGYKSFNLGLSALSGVGEHSQDPVFERGMHYIYEHLNQFYNFKGLHSFKEKFHPEWSPRYLIYPGAASLPAVALALVRADSGDDLLDTLFNLK
jgi:phosphatidylglycerol lysyltransferase